MNKKTQPFIYYNIELNNRTLQNHQINNGRLNNNHRAAESINKLNQHLVNQVINPKRDKRFSSKIHRSININSNQYQQQNEQISPTFHSFIIKTKSSHNKIDPSQKPLKLLQNIKTKPKPKKRLQKLKKQLNQAQI